jgi:hypothetical protein
MPAETSSSWSGSRCSGRGNGCISIRGSSAGSSAWSRLAPQSSKSSMPGMFRSSFLSSSVAMIVAAATALKAPVIVSRIAGSPASLNPRSPFLAIFRSQPLRLLRVLRRCRIADVLELVLIVDGHPAGAAGEAEVLPTDDRRARIVVAEQAPSPVDHVSLRAVVIAVCNRKVARERTFRRCAPFSNESSYLWFTCALPSRVLPERAGASYCGGRGHW